jgi:tetratricopeptide (TPR) repeat protein
MQYRNVDRPLPEIARELGVEAVVEGSIVRAGDRLRITVQLIDAVADRHLWAESYERPPQEMLALQTDVARAIAEEITANLVLKQQAIDSSSRSPSPEARESYFKARRLLETRTEDGMNRAVGYFDHAIKLDPHYAEAWSGLADSYGMLVLHNHLRPEDAYPKAKTAAFRAIQLDSQIAETHASLGLIKLIYDWDRSGAGREFSRAIALNPGYAPARLWRGWQLCASGQMQEALLEIKRAQELDPGSPSTHMAAGDLLYRMARYDDAIEAYRRVLEIDPSYWLAHKGLGHCYSKRGRKSDSEQSYMRAIQLSGGVQFAEISKRFLDWSRAKDPRFLLNKMSFLLKQKYIRSSHIARIYLDLGQPDLAFDWLERALQERDTNLLFLGTDDGWGVIRNDPRFISLLTRIGTA